MRGELERKLYLILMFSIVFALVFSLSFGIYRDKMTKIQSQDVFISKRLAYVYTLPNESTEATIFWCPSFVKAEKNKVSVAISTPLGSLVEYEGGDLKRLFRKYFRMTVPIKFLGFNMSGINRLENLSAYIYVTTPAGTKKFEVSLGTWIVETCRKTTPKLIITENSWYMATFVNGSELMKYEIGLFNPTIDETVYIMNISYLLDSQSLRTLGIACYNATSILDLPKVEDASEIPKESLIPPTGCEIPPREKRYLVMYVEVDPEVKMLLLRPKIEYKMNNSTFFMPGATMEFVRITESCAN